MLIGDSGGKQSLLKDHMIASIVILEPIGPFSAQGRAKPKALLNGRGDMSVKQIERIDKVVNRLKSKKGATFASTLSAWAHQSPR